MASNVYSKLLWGQLLPGAGTWNSPDVPSGFVWVVRDAVFFVAGFGIAPLTGFTLTDELGLPIFDRVLPYVDAQAEYHWHGHQVIEPGGKMVVTTSDVDWSWRISGYELSLP